MVSDLQGSARRHDPRTRRQGKGRRSALRARLQARRFHAARGRRICALVDRNKDAAAATTIYEAFDKKLRAHPLVLEGIREAKAGKKMQPLVDSAQAVPPKRCTASAHPDARGAKIWRWSICSSALSAAQPSAALLSLADLYESVKKPQMAIKI